MHTDLTIDNLKAVSDRPSRERVFSSLTAIIDGTSPAVERADEPCLEPDAQVEENTAPKDELSSDISDTPQAPPPLPTPRKNGVITAFLGADDSFLELIRRDLALGVSLEDMKYIKSLFASIKRPPSIAELFFVAKAIESGKSTTAAIATVDTLYSDDPSLVELFSELVRRYLYEGGDDNSAPSLVALSEFAALGRLGENKCGISLSPKNAPIFPDIYSGGSESFLIGDYYLTLSLGEPLGGESTLGYGVLLYPRAGEEHIEFFDRALALCREYLGAHPTRKVIKCTERGLLRDIKSSLSGALIEARLLPNSPASAEVVWNSYAPSVIVMVPSTEINEMVGLARKHGVAILSPIASARDLFTVNALDGNAVFYKNTLSSFEYIYKIGSAKTASEPTATQDVSVHTSEEYNCTLTDYSVSATTVGGDSLYEKLQGALSDSEETTFAVTGTLRADSCAVDAIVTLDSVCRNLSPRTVYSKFFIGEKTEITIIKLSKK